MESLVKSVAALALIVISSVGAFAASNTADTSSSNGAAVVGGIALLVASIVLPAFKSSKA